MSEEEPKPETPKRETILALTGSAPDGNAWLLAARMGSEIEIVVSEEKGADSSVLLSQAQAVELARALLSAQRPTPTPPARPPGSLKCADCERAATLHVTEFDSDKNEAKIIHFCDVHAEQYCKQPRPKPPDS